VRPLHCVNAPSVSVRIRSTGTTHLTIPAMRSLYIIAELTENQQPMSPARRASTLLPENQ
jgi:hypothetical protein